MSSFLLIAERSTLHGVFEAYDIRGYLSVETGEVGT